jgi:hypothetical protein
MENQTPTSNEMNGNKKTSDYHASIFQNALGSEKGHNYDMSSVVGTVEANGASGKEILNLQQRLRKDSLMKQRMSVAPSEKGLPNFINFQRMVDRNNSLVPHIEFGPKKPAAEPGVF